MAIITQSMYDDVKIHQKEERSIFSKMEDIDSILFSDINLGPHAQVLSMNDVTGVIDLGGSNKFMRGYGKSLWPMCLLLERNMKDLVRFVENPILVGTVGLLFEQYEKTWDAKDYNNLKEIRVDCVEWQFTRVFEKRLYINGLHISTNHMELSCEEKSVRHIIRLSNSNIQCEVLHMQERMTIQLYKTPKIRTKILSIDYVDKFRSDFFTNMKESEDEFSIDEVLMKCDVGFVDVDCLEGVVINIGEDLRVIIYKKERTRKVSKFSFPARWINEDWMIDVCNQGNIADDLGRLPSTVERWIDEGQKDSKNYTWRSYNP